jgi:hypothetical protein
VSLDDGATDISGNALAAGVNVSFTTLKSVGIVLKADANMSRVITPEDFLFNNNTPFIVGDTLTNEGARSVMTFDISAIPETSHSIDSATFMTRQTPGNTQGTPFADLGSVLLDHVTYVGIAGANSAFNSSQTAHSTIGTMFVEDQVVVELSVTSQVDDDLENRLERANQSQYMARFDTISDVDGSYDYAVFSRDLLELSITYLHP